jgi:hypothetical protein
VRKQQAGITETKRRQIVQGYWKFEIVGKFAERGRIAAHMSRPTAETVTRSSKTQVVIYGNVGKH